MNGWALVIIAGLAGVWAYAVTCAVLYVARKPRRPRYTARRYISDPPAARPVPPAPPRPAVPPSKHYAPSKPRSRYVERAHLASTDAEILAAFERVEKAIEEYNAPCIRCEIFGEYCGHREGRP